MSLSENGNGLVMPVGPMYSNGGSGFGWGEGGLFWIIVLFLFAFMGNGFGGFGGGNAAMPYIINNTDNDIQRGFDQQAVMGGLTGLSAAVTNGFANAEVSRCNSQANLLSTLNANQNANTAAMNGIAMSLQQCCCDNKAGLADLKYTVATEACADRAAVTDALRDLQTQNTANTQAIINSQNSGFQSIFDKMCQLELDSYKTKVSDLQTQLNISALRESQTDQTARVLADNAAQTAALKASLNPTPVPAWIVANPNGCGCGSNLYSGCGCGA